MSRSLIACAIDTGTTTIVRFKSAGQSAGIMTDCRTVRYGLEAMRGPKGAKTIGKLAAMLRKWDKEPVAIAISPESIRTLPAWFPATASSELRDRLGRIEAGFFLKNVDEWRWDSMPLAPRMDHPKELEEQVIMFYPAEPARSIDEAPGLDRLIVAKALHFEPIVRLTSGASEPMAVLELEKEYAAFFVSRAGRADYFRYWPVKNENEREFFAIKELGSVPASIVKVTGLAADAASMKRIAAGSTCRLEPLGLPPQVSTAGDAKGCAVSTGVVRAVSMALMVSSPPG